MSKDFIIFPAKLEVAAFSKVARTAKAMMGPAPQSGSARSRGRFLQSFDLVEVLIIVLPMAGSLERLF